MFIPDPKTRTRHLDGKEIGKTALPTNQRETFYIPFSAVGEVKLYVEPYMYTSTASLSGASATDKVFQYNATLQSCTFPSGSDVSIRPAQFKPVLAHYYYTEDLPYAYTDRELLEYLPSAISHLNNGYSFSYTSTGTISTFLPVVTTDDDKQLLALALAITVRTSYVHEQMRKGLGVSIRGPMQSIDTKSQLKEYNDQTKALTALLSDKSSRDKINDVGGSVDIYTENVVTA
jgi:hypothetical protein